MLKITKEVVQQIHAHGLREQPLEACGYLAGKEELISRYYPMTNVDKSPEHFTLDPQEQFQIVKTIRQDNLSLLAVCHTHPASPARPSPEDIRLAYDPQILYVIVSLQSPEPVLRAFRIQQGAVKEESLSVGI
ncbi:MAG: M67 family metallopeptidase [Candidatus Margulisbacteria bacterium]|jgi:proteasome lid subunit RPN8/RPN11|nr:M67 family metallopeptidase [Candidatus Margulisiibacteriota bacterium]